ncbi:hypothetical protein Tco_0495808 [Tanacetum coccineum]
MTSRPRTRIPTRPSEKFRESGMGKIRGKHFINGSKSVEGDLGVKNDVRLSCDVSYEKFVKSVFGDREKGRSFNEQNGKFSEKSRNFDERSDLMG